MEDLAGEGAGATSEIGRALAATFGHSGRKAADVAEDGLGDTAESQAWRPEAVERLGRRRIRRGARAV